MTPANRRGAWARRLARVAIGVTLAALPSPAGAQAGESNAGDGASPLFMVVGVVIPDRGIALAAIEDRTAMRTRFYRVGDAVNGGVVVAIAPDRVTIAFGDELLQLRLAGAAPPADDRASRARPARVAARAALESPARPDGIAGPYGTIGAIRPATRGARTVRKNGDDTGGATGGGPSAAASAAASVAADAGGSTVQFTGVLHGGREQPGDQFSAQSLRDLLISVSHTALSASRQRIELSTPEGGIYQTFSGDATPASQLRVPIGGTWITEHNLFGAWTVRVYLDRASLPAASAGFTLSQ